MLVCHTEGGMMPNPDVLLIDPDNRTPNRVDELVQEIAQLQKNCAHDLKIIRRLPKLKESLVPEVFWRTDEFEILCIKCTLLYTVPPTAVCPRCLGQMQITEEHSAGSEKFTKLNGLPFWEDGGEKLYTCSSCSLQIAERVILPFEQ
jgi:RecJ-like exonuclease